MTFKPSYVTWTAFSAAAALVTGGMTMGAPDGPVRMSGLRVSEIAGYEVHDLSGARVGQVVQVESDGQGRTRWFRIGLDVGGEARVAAFRADLDAQQKLVSLRLSEDLLVARADIAATKPVSSPSI